MNSSRTRRQWAIEDGHVGEPVRCNQRGRRQQTRKISMWEPSVGRSLVWNAASDDERRVGICIPRQTGRSVSRKEEMTRSFHPETGARQGADQYVSPSLAFIVSLQSGALKEGSSVRTSGSRSIFIS